MAFVWESRGLKQVYYIFKNITHQDKTKQKFIREVPFHNFALIYLDTEFFLIHILWLIYTFFQIYVWKGREFTMLYALLMNTRFNTNVCRSSRSGCFLSMNIKARTVSTAPHICLCSNQHAKCETKLPL